MFYNPATGHPLPHDPFKAIIAPRPIAWISSQDENGQVNLAPYSFFNAIADTPPLVMFSSTGSKPGEDGYKDSLRNIEQTGEFCVNIVSYALKDAMNISCGNYQHGEDEFAKAGLEKAPCKKIAPPRVAAAPASLECKLWQLITLPGRQNVMAIGAVVGVHIDDNCLSNGLFDLEKAQTLSRLGYADYAMVKDPFSLKRPS